MSTKQHLGSGGLDKIVNLKASLNLGLPEELQAVFLIVLK